MIAVGPIAPGIAAPLIEAYAAEMRVMLAGSQVASGAQAASLLDGVTLLGAFDAETPVGFLLLLELPEIVFARRCGQVEDLFVLPAYRGRGVARALLQEAQRIGQAKAFSHLRWFVPAGDEAAIALYEKVAERADWRGYIIRLDAAGSL